MPRNPGLWDGIPLGFSDGAMTRRRSEGPQQQQDIPRVMEITKNSGWNYLPAPGGVKAWLLPRVRLGRFGGEFKERLDSFRSYQCPPTRRFINLSADFPVAQ